MGRVQGLPDPPLADVFVIGFSAAKQFFLEIDFVFFHSYLVIVWAPHHSMVGRNFILKRRF